MYNNILINDAINLSYCNIDDETRVQLHTADPDENDYINASRVSVSQQ